MVTYQTKDLVMYAQENSHFILLGWNFLEYTGQTSFGHFVNLTTQLIKIPFTIDQENWPLLYPSSHALPLLSYSIVLQLALPLSMQSSPWVSQLRPNLVSLVKCVGFSVHGERNSLIFSPSLLPHRPAEEMILKNFVTSFSFVYKNALYGGFSFGWKMLKSENIF